MSRRIKLISDPNNFNKHTEEGMQLLEKSIEKVGVIESVTISEDNVVISGNARKEKIEKILGDSEPIVVETDGKSPIIIKRKDIKSGTKEFYEAALLANTVSTKNINLDKNLIEEIMVEELHINVEELGFDDIDSDINGINDNDDDIPDPVNNPIIKRGDLIEMNNHRLLCGDSCCEDDIGRLMNGRKANMVFTDPPYDMEDNSKWIGIMNNQIYDGHILVMIADKQLSETVHLVDGDFKRMYIADTGIASPTNNDVYVNHILTLRFSKGKFPKFNNIHNGGRSIIKMEYRKNNPESVYHPHSKPVSFVEQFLLYWSNVNDLIFEPFGGSGSTLIASEKNNRICYSNEYDPSNCDTILRRWIAYMIDHDRLFEVKINGKKLNESDINKISNCLETR